MTVSHQYDLDFESEPEHAELSASSAHRWIACPASIKASRGMPDSSGQAAEEGTAAHALAERCLLEDVEPHHYLGHDFNGFTVGSEMANLVKIYTDYCRTLPKELTFVERKVDYSMWVKDGWGTADYISIKEGEAWVCDLKFGRVAVQADCDQLKCYALGVFNDFGFDSQIDTVHMTIVQPRLGSIDTHTMRHKDLLKWAGDVLVPAAEEALSDNPTFNAGESQCRYCKAAPTCKPLANRALEALDAAIDEPFTPSEINDLSVEQISKLLPEIPLIKSWCEKVTQHASILAQQGTEIEGYKVVESKTNRRWADESEAMRVMQKLTNEPVFSAKVISPTQAIAMLGAKCDEVNALIVKPTGKPTLVPVSDKRQAISKPADLLDKLD